MKGMPYNARPAGLGGHATTGSAYDSHCGSGSCLLLDRLSPDRPVPVPDLADHACRGGRAPCHEPDPPRRCPSLHPTRCDAFPVRHVRRRGGSREKRLSRPACVPPVPQDPHHERARSSHPLHHGIRIGRSHERHPGRHRDTGRSPSCGPAGHPFAGSPSRPGLLHHHREHHEPHREPPEPPHRGLRGAFPIPF